jgi:hypothetical protein
VYTLIGLKVYSLLVAKKGILVSIVHLERRPPMCSLKDFPRVAIAVVVFLAIASLLTPNAFAQLSVSPSVVVFSNTPVGPDCPGANCSYAEVTITNNGSQTEHLTTAEATPNPPFWPTFGGTCNVTYAYYLPGGESCTFEWGFKPQKPGKFTGTGTISFESGASVGVVLIGKGKPH